jgi:soluble lytic murein transglycosylase-like protein
MTWNRVALLAVLGALAGAPAAARADVLEISPAGAEWIAGGSRQTAETPAFVLGDAPEVPDALVANVSNNAANVPTTYAAKVQELSARFDVSPALIEALVWQESRWRADARSPVGARGLAQLMPGTARDLGVNPDDPFANLEGGARYLREQLDRFGGDVEKALAAYNAGPGRVIRAGGIPRIRETQTYVAAIMGRLSDHSRR